MKNSALQVVLQYFHKLTSNINLDAFTKRHVYPSTLSKNINFDDINFDDLTGESMFKNNSLTSLPKNVNLDGITKMPMFEMFDEIKTK